MRQRRFFLGGSVAIAVAAAEFAGVWDSPAAGATATGAAFDKIIYRDRGGFTGGGTGKSLLVSGDGIVEARNRDGAPRILSLGQEELSELSSIVGAVDWPSIPREYLSPGAADLVSNDLTVVIRGMEHETRVDGLAKIPHSLRELLGRLEAVYRRAMSEGRKGRSIAAP